MSVSNVKSKYPVVTEGTDTAEHGHSILRKGNLEFINEYGGNNSNPSYQEASGAPVEHDSPLGYHVGWFTIIFLNVGQMIGTGVFSTRIYSLTPVLSILNACIHIERGNLTKLTLI